MINSPMPQIAGKSSYDLDRDDDGDVDARDFELARERINAPVDDDRETLRELKRLKAQDALKEKLRREEEEENDRILEAERQYQRQANRGPIRRGFDKAVDYLKDSNTRQQPAPRPRAPRQRAPAPRRNARVPAPVAQRHQRAPAPAPQAPTRSRGLSGFSSAVIGSSSGRMGDPVSNPLSSFTTGLLPARAPATKKGSAMNANLKSFSASLLGGKSGRKKKTPAFLRLI